MSSEFRRFVEGGGTSPLDDRIARTFRHVAELPGLPDSRIQAVGRRLAAPRTARRSWFRYAVLVGALVACAGTAAGVVRMKEAKLLHEWASEARVAAEQAAPAAPSEPMVRLPELGDVPSPLLDPPSNPAPAGTTREPASMRRPAPASAAVSPTAPSASAPAAPAESSALGAEARLLRRAIESLRSEANPRKTLALLDEHRSTFPNGRLRANADLLRVDALLAEGSRSEALELLELLPIETGPRGDELLVTRGELRADHDCAKAVRDFDKALARALPEKLAERALRGRAVCRMRGGDRSAAEPDLRAYVQRFPTGKFAARARELLDER